MTPDEEETIKYLYEIIRQEQDEFENRIKPIIEQIAKIQSRRQFIFYEQELKCNTQ